MRRLQVHATKIGARLFRQNTGMAWVGKTRRLSAGDRVIAKDGDVLIRGARPFHAGVKGMSDLGGWVPVKITPDMVGQTIGVCVQVEVKENTKATPEQITWINAVKGAGGFAGIAHNEEELEKIVLQKTMLT